MRIGVILPLAIAVVLGGCALPPHIAQTMPDDKLCSVRVHAPMHLFANDEHTRDVVDDERARRELTPCPGAG